MEDAYAIVFDAICREALPKTPEFQQFEREFATENKRLEETTAGRNVITQLQLDMQRPPPINVNSPGDLAGFVENQQRCMMWLALMGARLNDLHEPGQLPRAWPLAMTSEVEKPSVEVETVALFRQVTPDDQRLRLPKALDWMLNGIPVGGKWRLPFPIAGIFRGMV